MIWPNRQSIFLCVHHWMHSNTRWHFFESPWPSDKKVHLSAGPLADTTASLYILLLLVWIAVIAPPMALLCSAADGDITSYFAPPCHLTWTTGYCTVLKFLFTSKLSCFLCIIFLLILFDAATVTTYLLCFCAMDSYVTSRLLADITMTTETLAAEHGQMALLGCIMTSWYRTITSRLGVLSPLEWWPWQCNMDVWHRFHSHTL